MFTLTKTTPLGRRGVLSTQHGDIQTPFFMPVGTAGAMKGLTHGDIVDLGAQIILSNTYHLHVHPGEDVVEAAGGLHGFMSWSKPVLTDSGGFQVYSLRRESEITDDGVHFHSHRNGDALFMGPKESIDIQHKLGADIIMCFDECPPSTADRSSIERAVERTIRWAEICKAHHEHLKAVRGTNPLLFGIVQGGLDADLRRQCAEALIDIGFDGYAIGGLAVGESESDMLSVVEAVTPHLPQDKPRYLMGVGVIDQLRACVERGIDMFDCVLPMRLARHGKILLSDGQELHVLQSAYRDAHEVIDPESPSVLGRTHLRSLLHHLLKMNERLGETIASHQNMAITLHALQTLREKMDD